MFLVKPKTSDLVLYGPDGRRVPDAGVAVPEACPSLPEVLERFRRRYPQLEIKLETGDPALLGKPVGSDAANEKTTFVSLLGLEESRAVARREVERAIAALPDAGSQTAFLHALARYVVDRNS